MESQPDEQESTACAERRKWLRWSATAAMSAGLAVGYGSLGAMAGRYLFSVRENKAWLFVAPVDAIRPGESFEFEAPTGVRVTVTRRNAEGTSRDAAEFSALSSVCPHLGCRVHWESQNHRYFCPCHNGVFDPEGVAIEGPPAAANQALPRYALRVDQGLVFIEMPLDVLGDSRRTFVVMNTHFGAAGEGAPSDSFEA